jgi:surfactin synthase thioesterase subunit
VPTLRADPRRSEAYELGEPHRLSCPIYAYGGEADPIVVSHEFERWGELISGECEVRIFKGDISSWKCRSPPEAILC